MLYIKVQDHSFNHDIYELIKAMLGQDKISYYETDFIIGDDDYLLIVSLKETRDLVKIESSLKKGERLIGKSCETIDNTMRLIYDFKREVKQGVKRSVYDLFTGLYDRKLPWGILTGIRPVKIVHDLHEKGIKDKLIQEILVKDYRLDAKKAQMIREISSLQRKHIYPLDENKYSLYIGIPFCPSKCSYCSFPSYKIEKKRNRVGAYIESLIRELSFVKEIMGGKALNTVYIGGGTPSSLRVEELEKVISFVRKEFDTDIKEFTVEAGRPDTINSELLIMLRNYGVDRISINPQTMNNETLERIGRSHRAETTIEAYNLAKKFNFDIINMDLILGLPGEDIKMVRRTMEVIKELNPENLTVHSLAIKRGSSLHKKSGNIDLQSSKEMDFIFNEVDQVARELALNPYYLYRQKNIMGNLENIGYSKKDMESIYNISMMEEKETIIGAGLGAVSKIYSVKENRIDRLPNYKTLHDYIENMDQMLNKKVKYFNK